MGESVGICVPGGLNSIKAAQYFLKEKCKIASPSPEVEAAASVKLETLRKGKSPDDYATYSIPELWECGGQTPEVIPADFAICTEAQALMGAGVETKDTGVVIEIERGKTVQVNFPEQLHIEGDTTNLYVRFDDALSCQGLAITGNTPTRTIKATGKAGEAFAIIVEKRDSGQVTEAYKATIKIIEPVRAEREPVKPRAVAGKCGPLHRREFPAETHSLSGRPGMCTTGEVSPKTVSFKASELIARWHCLGKNGGDDDDCAATRKAPAPAAAARIAPAPAPVAPPPPPPAPVAAPPVPAPVAAPAPEATGSCAGKTGTALSKCQAKNTED